MAIGLQPPLQHEVGLVLLGGDEADDVFIQALGRAVFVDVGDEAPLVFLLRQFANRVGIRTHWILPDAIVGTSLPRASLMLVRCNGCTRSESVIFSSTPRTAWLMIRWLLLIGQLSSRLQRPETSVLHSVRAMGPSIAAIISITEIWCGSLGQHVAALGAAMRDKQPALRAVPSEACSPSKEAVWIQRPDRGPCAGAGKPRCERCTSSAPARNPLIYQALPFAGSAVSYIALIQSGIDSSSRPNLLQAYKRSEFKCVAG